MKNLLTTLLTFTIALGAIAEVPSLINYQGKLTGLRSTGSQPPAAISGEFKVRIFDQKTGGKLIYQEDMGILPISNDGVYSFGFGEAGKSVSTATETIGFTDGEKQVYNYTVKNTPILGETKISASDFTWTESGPSDPTKLTATENKSSGAITIIYTESVPEVGEKLSISYEHHSDGIMGALSRGGEAWLELTFKQNFPGEQHRTFSPRERLVTVPFALKAGVADKLKREIRVPIYYDNAQIRKVGLKAGNYSLTSFPHKVQLLSNFGLSYPKETNRNLSTYTRILIPKGLDFLKITLEPGGDPILVTTPNGENQKYVSKPVPLAVQIDGKTYPPTTFVYRDNNTSTILISNPEPGSFNFFIRCNDSYTDTTHSLIGNVDIRIIGIYK